ncbi:hypothetical protein B0H13DRAFT_2533139, partial [Mycena leptocephala]
LLESDPSEPGAWRCSVFHRGERKWRVGRRAGCVRVVWGGSATQTPSHFSRHDMDVQVDLQRDSDDLFYATFPDARPSPRSALVAAERARIFMPPCTGAAVGRGVKLRGTGSEVKWGATNVRAMAEGQGRKHWRCSQVWCWDNIFAMVDGEMDVEEWEAETEISKGSVEGDTAVAGDRGNQRKCRGGPYKGVGALRWACGDVRRRLHSRMRSGHNKVRRETLGWGPPPASKECGYVSDIQNSQHSIQDQVQLGRFLSSRPLKMWVHRLLRDRRSEGGENEKKSDSSSRMKDVLGVTAPWKVGLIRGSDKAITSLPRCYDSGRDKDRGVVFTLGSETREGPQAMSSLNDSILNTRTEYHSKPVRTHLDVQRLVYADSIRVNKMRGGGWSQLGRAHRGTMPVTDLSYEEDKSLRQFVFIQEIGYRSMETTPLGPIGIRLLHQPTSNTKAPQTAQNLPLKREGTLTNRTRNIAATSGSGSQRGVPRTLRTSTPRKMSRGDGMENPAQNFSQLGPVRHENNSSTHHDHQHFALPPSVPECVQGLLREDEINYMSVAIDPELRVRAGNNPCRLGEEADVATAGVEPTGVSHSRKPRFEPSLSSDHITARLITGFPMVVGPVEPTGLTLRHNLGGGGLFQIFPG